MPPVDLPLINQLPSSGQLVEVRRRQWIVIEVDEATLFDRHSPKHHLVSLTSIDEDDMGETLQVVWEIEPGARVLESAGLPNLTGIDSQDRIEAFLDAIRWGAATNADRSFLQSPFRSGISIEDYQLDPVVRAIDMARVNLLIADDVGLGKTIEAGLVVQELLVRHRARTVMIICPASLQIKWQVEMHEKFGLEFRIVDTEYLKRTRREFGIHANPWTSYPRLITSMDWVKSGEALRLMKDALPPHITYPRKFDILIVDEAHNVAPAMATHYNVESHRTSLVRRIAPHFEHKLFLSATPHNGYQSSFTSLLELLDDQRFARNVLPPEKQLQRVMVRRLKNDIVDSEGNRVFPKRNIEGLDVYYTAEERQAHELFQVYTNSRLGLVKGGKFEYRNAFVLNLLKKRLFSSPRAFAMTLEKHRLSISGKLPQKKVSNLDDRILRKAISRLEEDYANDEDLEEAIGEAVEKAGAIPVELTQEQTQQLDRLTQWADIARNRPDSKAQAIIDWIDSHLKTEGKWNGYRVILFTEYRATHSWLFEILTNHGYGGDRLMMIHGSLDQKEREIVMAAFQANPKDSPVRILLATDAASEGIDLQNFCHFLIHVEIPWNPNVMEQRNGRIDRHGQKQSDVFIWHPVGRAEDTEILGDHDYLFRAVKKVESIRQDLGSVGPVISHQIEEAMLGKREDLDTRDAENKAQQARKYVPAEKRLQEKISRLHEKLMEAKKDFHLSPYRIIRAVKIGIELANKPPLIPLRWSDAPEGSVFKVPEYGGSWGRATVGLNHPHSGRRRPITFDHGIARGRDDLVLAHLNHPLVQMCLRILRAEVWALDDRKTLSRVSIRQGKDSQQSEPILLVWSRLVITGGNRHRLHEELTLSGGELKSSSFVRIPQIGQLETLYDDSLPLHSEQVIKDDLIERFDSAKTAIMNTVEARSRDRLRFLENTLQRRKSSDIQDITTLLKELERAIRSEIEDSGLVQTELWPEPERFQMRKDVDALQARLKRIPEEMEKEISGIESRYSDFDSRTFPVAISLILPPSQYSTYG